MSQPRLDTGEDGTEMTAAQKLTAARRTASAWLRPPPRGLHRVRWYYLIFVLSSAVSAVPGLALAAAPPAMRLLATGGLLALLARRFVEYRNGRLLAVRWDAVELVVLLGVGLIGGYGQLLGLFYSGSFFRAVLGSQVRTAVGTSAYVGTLLVVGAAGGNQVEPLVGNAIGLASSTLLTFLMRRTLAANIAALSREGDRVRRILDTATDAFVEIDSRGRITDWNPQASATFGWPREVALGRSMAELLIPPPLRVAHNAAISRLADDEGRQPATGRRELPALHRDGRVLTVEMSLWATGEGELRRFNGLLHDVTSSRRAEDELREARDRFELAFHNAPIGMVLATTDGAILEVNRVFCRMLGRDDEELLGLDLVALTHPEDRPNSRDLMAQAAAGARESYQLEKRYRHADGGDVWVILSVSVTRDAAGEPLYLVGQAQDVTQRRVAERALQRERTFVEAILENLDTGVVACDAEGRLTLFNRASRQLHRMTAQPVAADIWAANYDLYRPDGVTRLPLEEIPLFRAFSGEQVHNVEMVVAPPDGEARVLLVNARQITDDEGELLGAVAAMHDVTDRRRAEEALTRQALHDPLTDLGNRLLLRDRLEHALARSVRQPTPVALLLLDLDGFKTVNDSLGHDAGDRVLVAVADRLRSCLRPDDTVARLGGDEFAVLLENTTPAQAMTVATEIQTVLRAPVTAHGRSIVADASVGIAVSHGEHDADRLLRDADLAMYAGKSQGKGHVQLFETAMHEAVLERLTLEAELREAVDEEQFFLHYQPIVSLITGELQGFEALARWESPRRGRVPPATFVPTLEATGLIEPLGEWMLRQACRQARRWRDAQPAAGELTMSVNLSVRQLQSFAIAGVVVEALADTGLAPEQLLLEITESVVMHRGDALAVLHRLRAEGVRLAIDDFGTGYSSLGRLHLLPIDKLKIDKSFIDGLADGRPAPIVAATIAMAHSLGLQTVAEGVETAEQLPFLRLHGCDEVQGYLFGRPTDAATITAQLRERGVGRRWTEAVAAGQGSRRSSSPPAASSRLGGALASGSSSLLTSASASSGLAPPPSTVNGFSPRALSDVAVIPNPPPARPGPAKPASPPPAVVGDGLSVRGVDQPPPAVPADGALEPP